MASSRTSGAAKGPRTGAIAPMLATVGSVPPLGEGWVYEPKLDGYRLVAHAAPDEAHLFTRSGREVTEEFRTIAEAVRGLAKRTGTAMVLDGEVVVQQGEEAPRFQHMQRFRDYGQGTLRYYVFDLLREGDEELTRETLAVRRRRLEALLRGGLRGTAGVMRLVPRLRGDGAAAFRKAVAAGYEGVMAKRDEAPYYVGRRSDAWLKVKRVETEDLVVGGYTQGTGRRARTLGALLVGNPTPGGRVEYAGHVGTGFDERMLRELLARLEGLRGRGVACPFVERPPVNEPATWVRPELVVEVRYAERTEDGILRAPVFVRVRDDKSPAELMGAGASPGKAPALRLVVSRPAARKGGDRTGVNARDGAVAEVLEQLERLEDEGVLEIGRERVRVTSLDKPLWTALASRRMRRGATASLTKRDLLRYLARVSPALLAHLRHRPVTLTRYPQGAGKPGFYQRHWDEGAKVPRYIRTVAPAGSDGGDEREYLLIENLAALIHAGQLGALELHPWYMRVDSAKPDFLVFDLDSYLYAGTEKAGEEPAPHAAGFEATRQAAWLLKAELDALALPAFVKTSGKTGLHVFVPIRRRIGFEETHALAQTVCEHLEKKQPTLLTTSWAVGPRRGKVFLDYNQNARSKTLAAAYSPRAASGAPVSTPVEWEELNEIVPASLTIHSVPERLAERGDAWADILEDPVDLGARLKAA